MKTLKLLPKLFLVACIFAGLFLTYEYLTLPDVTKLKSANPRITALMAIRDDQYRRKGLRPVRKQAWVPYYGVSDHLKKAVVLGEDGAFFDHAGVDFFELKEALREDLEKRRFKRGASTITMQLARNLYLSPERSPLRKAREIMLAFEMERILSKRRILEIYLNVVEWGPGIYGAEMASRHYFSTSAANLSLPEAATLAALLPSPLAFRDRGFLQRRKAILRRMLKTGYISEPEFDTLQTAPPFQKTNGTSVPLSESETPAGES